jgi:3-phenylpropionate/trans-cinnamate dioxygenase ferredoxin component
MGNAVFLCKTSDVPDPGKRVFEVDDRFILVCHVGGQFYAIDDCCTHDGGPLGEGRLDGHQIACPRHGATFDVRDGRVLAMPATKNTTAYRLQVRNNDVFVEIDE